MVKATIKTRLVDRLPRARPKRCRASCGRRASESRRGPATSGQAQAEGALSSVSTAGPARAPGHRAPGPEGHAAAGRRPQRGTEWGGARDAQGHKDGVRAGVPSAGPAGGHLEGPQPCSGPTQNRRQLMPRARRGPRQVRCWPNKVSKRGSPPGGSPSPSNRHPEGVTVTSHASPSFQQGDGPCASVSKVMKLDARFLFPTAARGWHRGPSPAQGPHVPPSPPAASPGYTSCLIRPFLPKPRPLWHARGNLPSPG